MKLEENDSIFLSFGSSLFAVKSQSLSRSYGSGWPTSLTYIVPTCQRLFTLETCCGYGYGRREIYTLSPGFSRASESSPDAAGTETLSKARPLSRGEPIPGRPALHKEKRTLPGAPAGFSGIGRVTALDASRRPSPPLRIRGSEPDSLSIGRGQRRPSPVPSERHSPISQDRLSHVQLLFTWNPSPLRPSKFSFEYLLQPPRSAPAAAPPGPRPRLQGSPQRPSYWSLRSVRGGRHTPRSPPGGFNPAARFQRVPRLPFGNQM
ncbi:uncharacterized protein LOC127673184 [Apodemus sylvaticus]|uniref:uncharacterized protein LOC127673184 n=1 Tax=Apodemus sylvaticus TaxID=10129 RepID=UPI0022445B87|nr:uncharacterized protein LOC127673184 [Apodemus sylvaticus]